jgi:short-subunit dehydrogenase
LIGLRLTRIERAINDPEKLARLGLDKLFKGKVVIIPGFINKLLLFIGYISPSKIKLWILGKEFRKEIGK